MDGYAWKDNKRFVTSAVHILKTNTYVTFTYMCNVRFVMFHVTEVYVIE